MLQLRGKKIIENYLARVEQELDRDAFAFFRTGVPPTEEETGIFACPGVEERDRIHTIPGLVDRFVQAVRARIPEEIFILERASAGHGKTVEQIELILKSAGRLPMRELTTARRALADAQTGYESFRAALQARNTACRGGRAGEYTSRQATVEQTRARYLKLCDELLLRLTELLPMLPQAELARIVGILRGTPAALASAFDRELSASEEERTGRAAVFLSPLKIADARLAAVEHMKALLLHLNTVRRRALLFKSPVVDMRAIFPRHDAILSLLPYFQDLASRVKPASPIENSRAPILTVIPVGRLASPYTRAVTSKGKETRMVEVNYYNPTNVMVISGAADAAREPGEVSEIDRVLGEYVFDTLTLHKDYIRDPVGVGKEKGPYYSVTKARLQPELAELLKDTLDLRWHFSEDFVRFADSLAGRGEPLPHELDTWFRCNLVNPDFEGGAPPAPEDAGRGRFGVR